MAEECCSGMDCGCNATSLYTNKDCPTCGRRLRVTGNLQQIRRNFTCLDCGYQSPQLSLDEVREVIA